MELHREVEFKEIGVKIREAEVKIKEVEVDCAKLEVGSAAWAILRSDLTAMRSDLTAMRNKENILLQQLQGQAVPSGTGQIGCNLAGLTPHFKPDAKGRFEGVNLYRLGKKLFVDTGAVKRVKKWLRAVELHRTDPLQLNGPPPLFVIGLVKTGKTCLLTQVLLAVLAKSSVFGIGRSKEARVIKLDLTGLPVKQGFQAMLRDLLEDVVKQMRELGFASQVLTLAADALAKPKAEDHVSATMFWHLFQDPPVPVLLLIDEVQNLLLPRVPESGAIDGNAQYTAMLLLKKLFTNPSPKLLVAVTGSSMALFMLQVGRIPPNGINVLTHAFNVDVAPKHEPLVLQKVLDDEVSRLATTERHALSEEERQELLAACQSAAVMMQALSDFLIREEGSSMHMFLTEFIGDKMMREGMNEWGVVLRNFTPEQRRAFLGLALTNEGLNLFNLPSLSLRSMLRNLTVPIKPGSNLKVFATSYHRTALQMLIRADGRMCDLSAILSGNVHIGWVDACLHLLAAGNFVKAWKDAKTFKRAVELLQEPAEQLVKDCRCAADDWHKQDWFKDVLYHGANQGAKGTGTKVDSLTAVSPKGAAGRYKAALQRFSSLSAGEHLAHYLMLLRNVVAHMGGAVSWGEGAAGSGSGPAAAADGESEGSKGEEGSAVEEPFAKGPVETLENLGLAGKALSCAEILAASPAAQPFAQVVTRYHRILTSMQPTKQSKTGGSAAACLPSGASGGFVSLKQGRGLASGSLLLGGLHRVAGPQPKVVASPLRPARAFGNNISSRRAATQPRAALRRVASISVCRQHGAAGGMRWL